ncbi:MAG: hypothetical protein ACI3ZN_06215 [Candidatus Cryptobacteroides sp.]
MHRFLTSIRPGFSSQDGINICSYGATNYIIFASTGGDMDVATVGISSGWGGLSVTPDTRAPNSKTSTTMVPPPGPRPFQPDLSVTFEEASFSVTSPVGYSLGATPDEEFKVDFWLMGYLCTDKGGAIDGTEVKSNVVSATYIPYNADILDVDTYDHIWVIGAGESVGAWGFDGIYSSCTTLRRE